MKKSFFVRIFVFCHKYLMMIKNIFKNRSLILEGWRNFYFKKVTIEEVADVRRAICQVNKCGAYKTKSLLGIVCNDCGCPIEKKIRSLRSACPYGLWGLIDELQLLITPALFDKSDFCVYKVEGKLKYYRHKKHPEIVIIFNPETRYCTNGILTFNFWKDIQDYFKDKTGKKLN